MKHLLVLQTIEEQSYSIQNYLISINDAKKTDESKAILLDCSQSPIFS